jgi:hypothetical protein
MISMTKRVFTMVLVASLSASVAPAAAQNWSGDARRIAMGGVGTSENLASKMIEEEKGHRTVVVPLGLFQVLKDLDIFNPDSDRFDLVRAIEYAASPLHFTVDRDGTGTGALFVNDIRNGELSRNLNVYRGFVPVNQPIIYGLGNPSFGGTIPVYRSGDTRHGIYVGAGPYIGFRGGLAIDDQLVDLLASETDVFLPNAALPITTDLRADVALAITGGYRGRFAVGSRAARAGSIRDGVYVAFNYSYLRGFRHEDADLAVRLDTDNAGLLTVNPALPPPARVIRQTSDTGRGRAIDAGVATVINGWEIGFGVNGIANEIRWRDVEGTSYTLSNLFTGGDFEESATVPLPDVTTKQPVEYTGDLGYRAERWTAVAQLSERRTDDPADDDRFDGRTFRSGFEYRFGLLEPRVGTYYTRETWHPAAGLGLNFGSIGLDSAIYTTDANVQRKRRLVYALSLRFGRRTLS